MSSEIEYEPTGNLTLSDGKNHITLPQWTRGVLSDIFGHETERLQDENKNLRRERDFYFQRVTENGERAHEAIDALNAENEKLRELVRKVDHYERLGCYDCPHSSSCDVGTLYDDGCAMSREIEREMRELGIEVDA